VNRDQLKGAIKNIAGKIQRKVGRATGDTGQQIKGAGKQIEGQLQRGSGDVREAAKNANKGKV
jgi:uncharacterized protein YjbJ (UPF0337 family)